MNITLEELVELYDKQGMEIDKLNRKIEKLQAWSDYNDLELRELFDNLVDTVDKLQERLANSGTQD